MQTRDIAMVILATTLIDSGLLEANGKVIPKRKLDKTSYSLEDEELVGLFKMLNRPLTLKVSNKILKIINSLPDGENQGNLLLVSLDLLIMGEPISSLFYMKATRLQDTVVKHMLDKSLVKKSYRIADNLHRVVTNRPMLDNALRDMQRLAKIAKEFKDELY